MNLEELAQRRSVPARQLGGPGLSGADLGRLLAMAVRVPDHGHLTPWRMLLLHGSDLVAFGDRLAELAIERNPDLPEHKRAKDRDRYHHAPLVVVVIARIDAEHPKAPVQEQVISAGFVAYNLLQGAQALGCGAQLLTGWAAYDADVAALLGLAASERVIGFVHIGTPLVEAPERLRPPLADVVSDWHAP